MMVGSGAAGDPFGAAAFAGSTVGRGGFGIGAVKDGVLHGDRVAQRAGEQNGISAYYRARGEQSERHDLDRRLSTH